MSEQPLTSLIVGIPKETLPGERRVAIAPLSVGNLTKAGCRVLVETGAGEEAGFSDDEYSQRGAHIVSDRPSLFAEASVILQVNAAGANPAAGDADLALFQEGQLLIAQCNPLSAPDALRRLAEKHVTTFALELLPRITRAQNMDVLSSMATVAGYKAVLIAAHLAPRMFPMLMTAAGTITPARVFVVGAGVAGLQAIATARRLGAVVRAYDIRPVVKEQVESLGARFVELDLETDESEEQGGYARKMDEEFYRKQREKMTEVVADSDVVITTAAVPGKQAPVLVTAEMVQGMKRGSVIVDLAADSGGNCELTQANETRIEHGVTIIGPRNLPAGVPLHASEMFSRNMTAMLLLLVHDGAIHVDDSDEIVHSTLVTRGGEVVHPQVRELLGLESLEAEEQTASDMPASVSEQETPAQTSAEESQTESISPEPKFNASAVPESGRDETAGSSATQPSDADNDPAHSESGETPEIETDAEKEN